MALIRLDHYSEYTRVNQQVYVLVPESKTLMQIPLQQRKVIWLMHGLSDDASTWQRFTNVEALAEVYGFIAVMPSVDRSFYLDFPNGRKYFSYLTEELPKYLKNLFQLDSPRENTYVAGISMGGYGAIKLALSQPERFRGAASFSGFLSLMGFVYDSGDHRIPELLPLFGERDTLLGGPHDPQVWLETLKASGKPIPELYISCGRQDDLYPLNQLFMHYCTQAGVPMHYYEEDNDHNWFFWGEQLKRLVETIYGKAEWDGQV